MAVQSAPAPQPAPVTPGVPAFAINSFAELVALASDKRDIQTKSVAALFNFILADLPELKRILFDPQSHQVFMTAIEATWWLNDKLQVWLG